MREMKCMKKYWYEYRLRGFSLGCQPKDFVDVDNAHGKWGAVAYNRELTDEEVNEYELNKIELNATDKLKEKYPLHIIEFVRQRCGLEPDDMSMDGQILNMTKSEVFKDVLNWNGLLDGYDETIKGWIESIYGVDLDKEE